LACAGKASNSKLLLTVLDRPFSPFPNNGSLSLPNSRESQARQNQGFHITPVRNVDFNGVCVITHAEHDGDSNMDIAAFQKSLNIHAAELFLGRLSSNTTQSKQHPV
jgi:hypothetical protein